MEPTTTAPPNGRLPGELCVDDLYRRHRTTVQARCRRILGDRAAAEDAAHETFIKWQRSAPPVSDGHEALRWMRRVATNHCLNQVRDRRFRAACHDDPVLVATTKSFVDVLTERSVARWILENVPKSLRAIAWLHHVDGLDQQEVADLLGISRRTVTKRVAEFQARARRLLKSL